MEVCKPTKSIVDVTANSNLKVEIVECGLVCVADYFLLAKADLNLVGIATVEDKSFLARLPSKLPYIFFALCCLHRSGTLFSFYLMSY